MTREEKITRIYEVIADKTISFGCKVKQSNGEYAKVLTKIGKNTVKQTERNKKNNVDTFQTMTETQKYVYFWGSQKEEIKDIIGHPVMIGDVLDFILEKFGLPVERDGCDICGTGGKEIRLTFLRGEPRKNIDEQSEECIDYVLSLI